MLRRGQKKRREGFEGKRVLQDAIILMYIDQNVSGMTLDCELIMAVLRQNFLVISVIIIVILMMGMGHRRPRGGSQVDDVLYGSSTVCSPRSLYAGVAICNCSPDSKTGWR